MKNQQAHLNLNLEEVIIVAAQGFEPRTPGL